MAGRSRYFQQGTTATAAPNVRLPDAPSSSRDVTSRDQDSYDALAVSIERLLRIDISAPNITTQLAVSIDRIMLEEAWAGELRLAWVRLLVVAPYLLITLWAIVDPGATEPVRPVIPSLVLGAVWLAGAVALVAT